MSKSSSSKRDSLGARPPWCSSAAWSKANAEYERVVSNLRALNTDAPEGWLMKKEQAAAELAFGFAVRLNAGEGEAPHD